MTDTAAAARSDALPPIPLVDLGAGAPAELVAAERARTAALLDRTTRGVPRALLRLGDELSRRWLERAENPYLAEIEEVAATLGRPGAWFLNVNYEWGCTGGVAPAQDGAGSRLLRVLDWRLGGLGASVIALRRAGPAGSWTDLTWPGFVGAIQGLAPGRFAAALNQAPLRRHVGIMPLDWAAGRRALWRDGGLPPAHLLRRVFDEARDYAEAKAWLAETPLALPAIFLLSGPGPGEGCVIERLETRAFLRPAPAAAANHWAEAPERARPRGQASRQRQASLQDRQEAAGGDFDWLVPPVLNPTTRLAMMAEPATGRLVAQGFEAEGPATRVTEIAA